jgi:hypothetical protein
MIFIDFSLLVQMLLPHVMQQPLNYSFMGVITSSINITQTNSTQLYNELNYSLKFNELKIYVEHYLNDQHDDVLRRIYIDDVVQVEDTFIFNTSEQNEELWLWNNADPDIEDLFIFNESEIDGLNDFIVYYPAGHPVNLPLLKSHIDSFKLPSLKYQIQYY